MYKLKEKHPSIWQNILLSLISIILFFSISEIALRLFDFKYNLCKDTPTVAQSISLTKQIFGPGCIPSNILGYKLEPDFEGEMWNTWIAVSPNGFRDKDISIEKPPNIQRIICIGDSSTLGPNDTYAKRLEYILNNTTEMKHNQYEVLNAGCAGYTSFMGLKIFEEKNLLSYHPDIVTIYFALNDEYMWHALSDKNSYKLRMLNITFQKSKVYAFLWKFITENVLKNNLYLTGKLGKLTIRVEPEDFKKNLQKINTLLIKNKIKALFITYPIKSEIFPIDQYQSLERIRQYNNIIREVSKKYNIALLDLERIFDAREDRAKLFADYCHPSYYGHSVIAEEIYKKLFIENNNNDSFEKSPSKITTPSYYDFKDNIDKAIIKSPISLTPTLDGCVINKDFRYCIFQHPPSQLIYSLKIDPNWTKLKFGIGLIPNIWSSDKGDGVEFNIDIDDDGKLKNIFSKYIDPKNNPQDRKWHDYEIDLTRYTGKEIKILLITSPGPKNENMWDAAVWSEPRIE